MQVIQRINIPSTTLLLIANCIYISIYLHIYIVVIQQHVYLYLAFTAPLPTTNYLGCWLPVCSRSVVASVVHRPPPPGGRPPKYLLEPCHEAEAPQQKLQRHQKAPQRDLNQRSKKLQRRKAGLKNHTISEPSKILFTFLKIYLVFFVSFMTMF